MPVGFDPLNTDGPQLMAPMDLYESIWGGMFPNTLFRFAAMKFETSH